MCYITIIVLINILGISFIQHNLYEVFIIIIQSQFGDLRLIEHILWIIEHSLDMTSIYAYMDFN